MLRMILGCILIVQLSSGVGAAMLGTGNILVSELLNDVVGEYTSGGVFVQSFAVPPVDDLTSSLRDLIVDENGDIHVYNGTATVELATIDPVTGSITSQSLAGHSTFNNGTYGGIAVLNDAVFLTDMDSTGTNQGIVRFSTTGDPAVRFATDQDYEDLTIGIDGYLYALRNIGDTIDVFDPLTNDFVRTIDLDDTLNFADIRGISVDADGTLYLAGWNGTLYAADADGNTLASLATGTNQLTDIDINNSGDLIVGQRFGTVIFADTSLSTIASSFTVSSGDQVRVAFTDPLQIQSNATVPEPGSLALLGIATCGVSLLHQRRKRTAHSRRA